MSDEHLDKIRKLKEDQMKVIIKDERLGFGMWNLEINGKKVSFTLNSGKKKIERTLREDEAGKYFYYQRDVIRIELLRK